MTTQFHFQTDTTSFTSFFLVVVTVCGVLNLDLFESDGISGDNHRKLLYRIELVFNVEHGSQSHVLSISRRLPENNPVEGYIRGSNFFATYFDSGLFAIQNTSKVNSRPVYSSHNHTTSFNIPHQNADEDEALIFPLDVA